MECCHETTYGLAIILIENQGDVRQPLSYTSENHRDRES